MVLVMVTPVIRVVDIIASNFFSCSPYSSLLTTSSQPASSGGGDCKVVVIMAVVKVAFVIRSNLLHVMYSY